MLKSFTTYLNKQYSRLVKKYSRDERYLRQCDTIVNRINALEPSFQQLSDQQLKDMTPAFKERIQQGESLDNLLPEAFATVRETARRVLGIRPFDVQLKGGIILHHGLIAEMKTGEGKTLVASLPVYLNALTGKGVHVVTVNDYLAQRDSTHMGHIYHFLGLTVGCIIQDLTPAQRYEAYHADITYGTNNEFGFDYLRDNMKMHLNEMCQRPFNYAIVDEVDSILIDEARTPLIISGPAEDSSDLYLRIDQIIDKLLEDDYEKEEKTKSIYFTDKGWEHAERLVKEAGLMKGDQLFQPINNLLAHHLMQALKAKKMFHRDTDYIVKDGQVIIIDEFTGRMMKGRRYSDGLHQALEAKERVEIESENQTLASITFQNYFRMYPKLAGMTGTAKTEAQEFEAIYTLPVVAIPTNRPVIRKDLDDEIFRTFEQKKKAIVALVKECYQRKQPVLVGTVSIEKSEIFSHALFKEDIPHQVLNARHHEKEASIIAEAGAPGAVTIATNMAGRGTDIRLGGSFDVLFAKAVEGIESLEERQRIEQEVRQLVDQRAAEVRQAGGLYIIGTERHESRRIDLQLRGRSGRQGDPGISKFFVSLEDDLMRIFGPNLKLMESSLRKSEGPNNAPITHPWITRAIEKAQQRVEAQHFDTRKHLLKYADVLNSQRSAVYETRKDLMEKTDTREYIQGMIDDTIPNLITRYTDAHTLPDQWDMARLSEAVERIFAFQLPVDTLLQEAHLTPAFLQDHLKEAAQRLWEEKEAQLGADSLRYMEKTLLLRTLDAVWREHLNGVEHLRQGIHLQAYGQKDPLNEYKNEAFSMFKAMIVEWRERVLSFIYHWSPTMASSPLLSDEETPIDTLVYQHPEVEERLEDLLAQLSASTEGSPLVSEQPSSPSDSLSPPASRNDPCPCGSGKRYKECHGNLS